MYVAYEAHSDDMKERIRRLHVLHSHYQVLTHDQKLKTASKATTPSATPGWMRTRTSGVRTTTVLKPCPGPRPVR
jgi:hypothetical protein